MKEKNETVKDEQAESPAKQEEEAASGNEGVILPEQFQREAHALVQKATTKHHTGHIRRLVDDKESEHRKAEMAKESKGKDKVPQAYSTEGMP